MAVYLFHMASVPSTEAIQSEIVPGNYFAPLDFEAIYGNRGPLEVDLGCGDGLFLATMACANPGRNFLGIERMPGRVRSSSRKIEAGRLTNARVLEIEIQYAVRRLLPPASVTAFHLMFPDPWPKRRHSPRRIVSQAFLSAIHRALAAGGLLRIATDDRDYFREIERLAASAPGFISMPDGSIPAAPTTFEKRFRQDGLEIHRLLLRKV